MIKCGIDLGGNWAKVSIMDTITLDQLYTESINYKVKKSYDSNNNIPEYKIKEIIEIINYFKEKAYQYKVNNIYAVATGGIRQANNSKEVIDKISNETGITVKLINGFDEAVYTWRGALLSFNDVNKRYVEIDIGSSTTEISYGSLDRILKSTSINTGSAILNNEYDLINRNITNKELDYIFYYLDQQFKSVNIPFNVNNVYILTGSSGFAPLILNDKSLTDTYIKSKPIWIITFEMVRNCLTYFMNHNDKTTDETGLSCTIILYFLMQKLKIQNINYSTLGLRHGIMLMMKK